MSLFELNKPGGGSYLNGPSVDTLNTSAGIPPVGKNLQAVWNVQSAAADTIQAVWNVTTPLGETIQAIWHVTVVAGDTIQAVWDVEAALGETIQLVWDVQTVADVAVAAPTTALFTDEGSQSARFVVVNHSAKFSSDGCQTGYFFEITGAVAENQLVSAGNTAPFT